MDVKAKLKTLRIPARKVRLVANLIRGKNIKYALNILDNTNKSSSLPIKKLLKSAIANAVNNNGLEADNLHVKTIMVNEGPTLKRFRPRAHGRAFQILKRTSHVEIIVSDDQRKGGK